MNPEEIKACWEWLNERERWASVSVDFERGGIYKTHRVTWYVEKFGWVNAVGQSFEAAVKAAMTTRIDFKTGEYFAANA